MRPKSSDPILLDLAAKARVRPPHIFFLLYAMSEQKGKFRPSTFAAFANMELEHVQRMIAVIEAEGLGYKKPETTEHGPRGTRLPADFAMPAELLLWAQTQRRWTREVAETEAATFIDYWHAQPGSRGVKLDWPATWRNWVRNSRKADGEMLPLAKPHSEERSRLLAEYSRLQAQKRAGEVSPAEFFARQEKLQARLRETA